METYIQKLGSSSSITQTIETSVSLRTEEDVNQRVTETHISSNGFKAHSPLLPEVPEDA